MIKDWGRIMDDMDDKVNTSQNTEYAGPPKSHAFQNNTLTPQSPQNSTQNESEQTTVTESASAPKAKESDLLEMISAGDKVVNEPKKKKKQISFDFKEINIYRKKVHEYLQTKTSLFAKLNLTWIILKLLFYVLGLGFFAVCFVLYIHFESLVGLYLKEHRLEDVTIQSTEYSLAGVTFTNVKEKNGLFQIDKMKASFSFASLLNKKIQQIEINGLRVFPQTTQNLADSFEALTRVLSKLGVLNNRSLFAVQTLRIENSQMQIANSAYQLTVNFSGMGSLYEKKQIRLPVNIESPNVSLQADMLIDFGAPTTSWKIDILTGKVNLPIFEEQTISGQILAQTNRDIVLSASFTGTLTKNGQDKDVSIQLNRQESNAYSLVSSLQLKNKDPVRIDLSTIDLTFDDDLTSFKSEGYLKILVSKFKSDKFNVESVSVGATSLFECNQNGCSIQPVKEGEFVVFGPQYRLNDTTWSVVFPINIIFPPMEKKLLSFDRKNLQFNFFIPRANFEARKARTIGESAVAKVIIKDIDIQAVYDIEEDKLQGLFDVGIQRFVDDLVTIDSAKLNLYFTREAYQGSLKAKQVELLQFPYFHLPVMLDASFDSNNYFSANINTLDKWLTVSLNGYYWPNTGEIVMAVKNNKPLILTSNSPQVEKFSSLVGPHMHNITGRVDFKGQIHYNNNRSINGPMQVLLDDVSFDYGNMKVKGLTSVLNVTHLVPFGTQGPQELFAQSIKTALPFENVHAQMILDATRKQFNISSLDASVAGYRLRLDPMWYGYNAPSYTFSLKGKSVPLQTIADNLTLKNLSVNGSGTFTLMAQLQEDQFLLRRLELSVPSEGMIRYTPPANSNPNLKDLDPLEFRRLSAYLVQQSKSFELQFLADNKAGKARKKSSLYFTIKDPLTQFIKSVSKQPVPESIVKAKQEF